MVLSNRKKDLYIIISYSKTIEVDKNFSELEL